MKIVWLNRDADKHFNGTVTYVIHAERFMFVLRIHFLERQKIWSSKGFTVGLINRTQMHFKNKLADTNLLLTWVKVIWKKNLKGKLVKDKWENHSIPLRDQNESQVAFPSRWQGIFPLAKLSLCVVNSGRGIPLAPHRTVLSTSWDFFSWNSDLIWSKV